MLEILTQWWGIIGVVVMLVICYFVYGLEATKGHVKDLIFLAEKKAREKCLETGKEKFEWVVEHGYSYLPSGLKLFISKDLFAAIVQAVFDKMVDWAEAQELK